MAAVNRKLSTMGLCYKAGKLIIGFDAVCDKIKNNSSDIAAVLISEDVSEKTKKEILFIAGKYSVHVKQLHFSMDEIGKVFNKKTAVAACLDEGFFKSIISD